MPMPFIARHGELSMIFSADDEPAQPTSDLIGLALRAVGRAQTTPMRNVSARMKQPPFYPDVWPGEHYRFLAALICELQPKNVVEIGTSTGLSSLAMRQTLPTTSTIHTFDIIPWNDFSETCLCPTDFEEGTFCQIVEDVGDPQVMKKHQGLFQAADFIFVDGPKDGRFEQKVVDHFLTMGLPKKPIVMFDDIRLWNMLAVWRSIPKPKLDVTSFGHWSGTGLVHWE